LKRTGASFRHPENADHKMSGNNSAHCFAG